MRQRLRASSFHIGFQKFNTLNILKAKGTLDQRLASFGAKAEWHQFATGLQLLEALNAGSLDFGHAADAPTAFGQAAGIPFVYVAAAALRIAQKRVRARFMSNGARSRVLFKEGCFGIDKFVGKRLKLYNMSRD